MGFFAYKSKWWMVENLTAFAIVCVGMRAYRGAPATDAADVLAAVVVVAAAAVVEPTTVATIGCCSCCFRNLPTDSR